jgi:hypothetical protein
VRGSALGWTSGFSLTAEPLTRPSGDLSPQGRGETAASLLRQPNKKPRHPPGLPIWQRPCRSERGQNAIDKSRVFAERRGAAAFYSDDLAVFERVDRAIDDLLVAIEVHGQDGALFDPREAERGLVDLGLDIVPGRYWWTSANRAPASPAAGSGRRGSAAVPNRGFHSPACAWSSATCCSCIPRAQPQARQQRRRLWQKAEA